jgi:hypothetical protein
MPSDRVERPGIIEIYRKTFGKACADAAYDAYARALQRDPSHEYRAVMAGHAAGRRCQGRFFRKLIEDLELDGKDPGPS